MKHIVLLSLLLIYFSSFCQKYTPKLDRNYQLSFTENFSSLDPAIWNNPTTQSWGLETMIGANATVNSNILTLKAESNYNSGGIETINKKDFHYGYFEVESKFPLYHNRGPWGGFWLYSGNSVTSWDEIDILEPNGCDVFKGNKYNIGSHYKPSGVSNVTTGKVRIGQRVPFPLPPPVDLSASFHSYSAIWTPKSLDFLCDDNNVFSIANLNSIPVNPMFMYLTFQIDHHACPPDAGTTFPLYWQFRNVKYFSLKTECDLQISNIGTGVPFDFDSHDYKVHFSYSLENSVVPSNEDTPVCLHAKEFIELRSDFEVPVGASFTAITHHSVCPNPQPNFP